MLNNISIMGRLVEDPELRTTTNGVSVTSFRIAVSRDYVNNGERETDFFDIDVWRQLAEFVCKHFEKGQFIAITGRLKNKQWKDKHDQKRTDTIIEADGAYFCESKRKEGEQESKDAPSGNINPFEVSSAPATTAEAPPAAPETPQAPTSPWD